MTQKNDYQTLLEKYGSITKAARAAGIPRSTFADRVRAARSQRAPVDGNCDCIPVAEVLAGLDVVGKVLAIVRAIPNGALRRDESLRAEMGLGPDRWRAVRASARVAGHVYQLPDKSWVWGSKSTISGLPAKLREMLV